MFLVMLITSFYHLLELNVTYGKCFDPRRGNHIIDITSFLEAPEVSYLSEAETHNFFVWTEQSIHVGMQTLKSVNGCQIELHLNKVIRIGYKRILKLTIILLPMTKLTSFQSERSSFLSVSTISWSLLFDTVTMGLVRPWGLNSPNNYLASSIHFDLSLSSLVES